MMDYETEMYYEEPEFQDEFGAYERVGYGRDTILATEIEGTGQLAKAQKKLLAERTGDEKLAISLDIFFGILRKQMGVEFSQPEQDRIRLKGINRPNAGHLNAVGLILGYLVTGRGKGVFDRDEFMRVSRGLDKNPELKDIILVPDLIRYIRLWLKSG